MSKVFRHWLCGLRIRIPFRSTLKFIQAGSTLQLTHKSLDSTEWLRQRKKSIPRIVLTRPSGPAENKWLRDRVIQIESLYLNSNCTFPALQLSLIFPFCHLVSVRCIFLFASCQLASLSCDFSFILANSSVYLFLPLVTTFRGVRGQCSGIPWIFLPVRFYF